ncbi:hypothetical protein ACFLR8_02350 [Bacteroidota bacterium]
MIRKISKCLALAFLILMLSISARASDPGLQDILDRGEDLLLEPGKEYILDKALIFRVEGQIISTRDAEKISDFATLRLAAGPEGTLINAEGIPGIVIETIIADGNRDNLKTPDGKVNMVPLISMGKEGGNGQIIRRCMVINSRSAGGWAAIHVHENCSDIRIEDNIIFSAGVDVRGNGRSAQEFPLGWGDGISTAARNSIVRNNLVIDAADEGIMVQGAPGTLVEKNMISAVSREMLAGIALIDPSVHYVLDSLSRRYDYRGIIVRDNIIDALGSRIHIGMALGGPTWGTHFGGTTLVGARIENNLVSGEAAAYGYAANGIDEFTVKGNKSTATYSGLGDGLPGDPPDPPGAFLYDPDHIGSSKLQKEFKAMERHLIHLMRNSYSPKNKLGYRLAPYGESEARAVVRWAFIEMLGREPVEEEYGQWTGWLNSTEENADMLRGFLTGTQEFRIKNDYMSPLQLLEFRTGLWTGLIKEENEKIMKSSGKWPSAKELYNNILKQIMNQ